MIACEGFDFFGRLTTTEAENQEMYVNDDLSPFHPFLMTQVGRRAKWNAGLRNITGEISEVRAMFGLRGRSLGKE